MPVGSVQVVLRSLAGEVFELDKVTAKHVSYLKCIAAKRCYLPCSCIRLSHEGKVLEDDEEICEVFKGWPEPIELNVYVSAESLYSDLEQGHADARLAALRDLQILGKRGDSRAVAAVIASVQGLYRKQLMLPALETLGSLAEPGDRSATEFAVAHLYDESDEIKYQALACLQQVAGCSNHDAIAKVMSFLDVTWNSTGSEPELWRAGCACLCNLSHGHFPSIIGEVVACLRNTNIELRQAVLQSLAQMAGELDESSLEALAASLEDENRDVRCAALEAIINLTQPSTSNYTKRIVAAVATCLNDGDPGEKEQAARVFSHIRSFEAWEELAKAMFNADADAYTPAYVAMLSVLRSWDYASDEIFNAMEPLLNNPDHDASQPVIEIVCTAVHSLTLSSVAAVSAARLALSVIGASSGTAKLHGIKVLNALAKFKEHLSTEDIVCAVSPSIDSADCELRAQACEALLNFEQSGSTDITTQISVALCKCESEDGVRQIAQVLSHLSDPARISIAIAAFAALLEQRSEDSCKLIALKGLKASTANLLPCCTDHCCAQRARTVALDHIHDANPEVAVAAVTVLEQLRLEGDADILPTLINLAMTTHHNEMLLALASFSQIGDETVLQTLRLRFKHGHWPMRHAALQALAKVAQRGCQHTCDFLRDCIVNDGCAAVRQLAVEVLASLSEPGDAQITSFLEDGREEQPFEVQMAIDDALESLAWVEIQA